MQRTIKQNNSLHLYFELLAGALNEAGLDMRAVMKPSVDIPWTAENVKNHLWRPIQKVVLNKESTTELSTDEISKVYDVLNRHLGEKFGVHEDFPSIDNDF
jgi:hypothetical protein